MRPIKFVRIVDNLNDLRLLSNEIFQKYLLLSRGNKQIDRLPNYLFFSVALDWI